VNDRLDVQELMPAGTQGTLEQQHPSRSQNKRAASLAGLQVIEDTSGLVADDLVHRVVRCPACHDKVFKRWPDGWDAHAAHKCEGLDVGDPQSRKAEFKQRFRALFK